MTVKDIKEEFDKFDGALSKIEDALNNISTGVDFYNAYNEYKKAKNGSPEQGVTITTAFDSIFTFGADILPPLMGGVYMDSASWIVEIIEDDVAMPKYRDMYYAEGILLYANGSTETASEYADRCMEKLIAFKEAIGIAEGINQLDQVFYDIGLINKDGEIDLDIYNDWENVLAKYAEEHGLYENAWEEFKANWAFGKEIINNFVKSWFNNTEDVTSEIDPISDKVSGKYLGDVKTQVLKAKTTKVDPIIFDLDGDGFNIETKEDGAYFDLDKNEFAEKINWTTKDGFLCLDLNNNGSIDNGGELFGDNTLLADGTEAANLNKGFFFT